MMQTPLICLLQFHFCPNFTKYTIYSSQNIHVGKYSAFQFQGINTLHHYNHQICMQWAEIISE